MAKKKPLIKLLDLIVAHANALSIIFMLVGLLGLLALPAFERRIKFDEKALMAGGAHSTLRQVFIIAMMLSTALSMHQAHTPVMMLLCMVV